MTTPPVSGYVMWLDAADSSTITSTGSSFVWRDKSSNNYQMTSQSPNTPATFGNITYTSSSPASVNFSGAGQYLQLDRSTTLANTPLYGTQSITSGGWMVFCVVKADTPSPRLQYALNFASSASAPTNIDDTRGIEFYNQGMAVFMNSAYVNGNYLATTADYFADFDTTRTTSTNIITMVANGTSGERGTGNPGWLTLSSPLFSRYLQGTIHEVLIYPVITSSERMQVEAYLATKWGQSSAFPASYSSLLSSSGGSSSGSGGSGGSPPSSGSGGSGSSAGDPYVSTVTNKIYKLPAFNGALRLYQGFVAGQQLTVNATTRIDDDKQAMDADNAHTNSRLATPVTHSLEMTEAMSFFDRIHVQLGESHAVFSVYDGFRQLSPLPAGWRLADKGTVADYLSGLPFYAHLAGSVHELSPCPGVTVRLGVVPIRHIRSTVEVAAPDMALGSGALVHRLSRKQMAIRKLEDTKPIAAAKDAPVKRVLREAFVCDRATTHADIPFMG